MKKKKKSASRRHGGVLPIDTYSLMGDPYCLTPIASSLGAYGGNLIGKNTPWRSDPDPPFN